MMTRDRVNRIAPLIVTFALILLGSALVWTQGIARDVPLHYDEAAHALIGLQAAESLGRGDVLAFAFDSYSQVLWPPLHAWVTGAVFLVAGPSRAAARAVSLAGYAALALALFALGREVGRAAPGDAETDTARSESRGRWCGMLAAAFALVAPLSRALAARVYLETPAAALLVLGVWLYLRAARLDRTRQWVGVGILIALTYLARSQYGLLLLGCVALDRLLSVRPSLRGWFSRANVAMLAPVALFVLIWFSYPPKALGAWYWLRTATAYVLGPQQYGAAYFALMLDPASGSSFVALYLVFGLLLSLAHLRERVLRVPVLLAGLQFVPSLFSPNHLMRLMYPLLLALDVLAAYWVTAGFERFARRSRRLSWVVAAGLAALLLLSLAVPADRSPRRDLQVDYSGIDVYDAPLTGVLAYIDAQARTGGPVLLLGAPDTGIGLDQYMLDWHAVAEGGFVPVDGSGVLYPPWSSARRG
jgi:4-amino-4-deoxy-L-arabinose transferase-like glycosyltransferase